jgi:3'(2'), 5'-bisphosphate nucleotidase
MRARAGFPGTDGDVALETAVAAGRLLLDLRRRCPAGASLGAHGDAISHRFVTSHLARLRPGDPVVSEQDSTHRPPTDRFWLVDPLDGTREYEEPGRDDWAVHVALIEHGVARIGAIAVPARGLALGSREPPPMPPVAHTPWRILVSRTRPPAFAETLATALGATLVPLGSAGAKAAMVALGEAEAYVHDGGQREWDSAAPVAVAAAAGLHVSHLDASSVRYGNRGYTIPDLLICHPSCASALLAPFAPVR